MSAMFSIVDKVQRRTRVCSHLVVILAVLSQISHRVIA